MEKIITIDKVESVLVFGAQDKNVQTLSKHYPDTRITARGNTVKLKGNPTDINVLSLIFEELSRVAAKNGAITDLDLDTILSLHKTELVAKKENGELSEKSKSKVYIPEDDIITYTYKSDPIRSKTAGQKELFMASLKNDIVFAIGPAGTGKTYTSVALAVRALKERKVKRIVLARPAVEAGENLGFLPGDLKEKIDPYLRPLYDALEEILEAERLKALMEKNVIEIAPLAYMRGRTLSDAFVILDEAQNATNAQLKMFLTRIGLNSKAIITGDITQTDLPKQMRSGLRDMPHILSEIDGIEFVHLEQTDVLRHALVRQIITAYDRYEKGVD